MLSLDSMAALIRYIYYAILFGVNFQLLEFLFLGRTYGKSFKNTLEKKWKKYVTWLHGVGCFSLMSLVEPNNLAQIVQKPLFEYGGGMSTAEAVAVTQIVKYLVLSFLALALYDFGVKFIDIWKDFKNCFLLNCHHFGVFITLCFGPYGYGGYPYGAEGASDSTDIDASLALNAKMFGWLWLIHAFGFLLEIIFPLIGLNYKEGERSKSLDAIKHIYSVVTCYFYYQYFNADCQPGVNFKFWENQSKDTPSYQAVAGSNLNYQTLSLFVMVMGRFFVLDNIRGVDFLRRVEFPGFCIIIFDHCMGHVARSSPDTMLTVQTHILDVILGPNSATKYVRIDFGVSYVAISIVATVLTCLLGYGVFFRNQIQFLKPAKYYGPEENEELKEFLEEVFEKKPREEGEQPAEGSYVLYKFDKEKAAFMKTHLLDWFSTQKDDTRENRTFDKLFPLHMAVVEGDAQKIEKLLLKGKQIAAAHAAAKDDPSENSTQVSGKEKGLESESEDLSVVDADDLSPNAICDPRHPKMDWSSPALMWPAAVHIQYAAECVYYLLKHGANPYLTGGQGSSFENSDSVTVGISQMGGKLGNCKDFWQRLNAICCKKSPPDKDTLWQNRPLLERMKKVVGDW